MNHITIQRRTIKHKRLPRKLKKLLRKLKWSESEPTVGYFMVDENDKFDLSKPLI